MLAAATHRQPKFSKILLFPHLVLVSSDYTLLIFCHIITKVSASDGEYVGFLVCFPVRSL